MSKLASHFFLLIFVFVDSITQSSALSFDAIKDQLTCESGFNCLGRAHTSEDQLFLVHINQYDEVGMAFYEAPVPMVTTSKDGSKGKPLSFETSFDFRITPAATFQGDGLAFIMLTRPVIQGSSEGGPYFGVFNKSDAGSKPAMALSSTVAVEFDTWQNNGGNNDGSLQDISDNHVGIDVNSIVSKNASKAGLINLRSGQRLFSWITYNANGKILEVRIDSTQARPNKVIVSYEVDLAMMFPKPLYMGFAATTGGGTNTVVIRDWKFNSSEAPESITSTIIEQPIPEAPAPNTSFLPDSSPGPLLGTSLSSSITFAHFVCFLYTVYTL